MHIKLELSASLPSHRIDRAVWVPEFYTLDEVASVLRASLGWETASSYSFSSSDMSWLPCDEIEDEFIGDGQFLAEGTTLSEVLRLWEAEGTVFQTGKREVWEFGLNIRDVKDTHPENLTSIMLDGQGDMPASKDEMRKIFLEVHEKIHGDASLLLSKTIQKAKRIERTLGQCAELVSLRSYEISRARRIAQY